VNKLLLEPAELAYLLQMLNASSLLGADNAQLFPEDDVANDALLEQGFERLQSHGWLLADAESSKMVFNDRLIYLIAVMASPDAAILTMRQEKDSGQQLIAYYLASQIIAEQMKTADRRYQLAFVPSATILVQRIKSVIQPQVENGEVSEARVLLRRREFYQVKNLIAKGRGETAVTRLKIQGVDDDLAKSLVDAMQLSTFQGSVVSFRRHNGRLAATHRISVTKSKKACWLLHMGDDEDVLVILEPFSPKLLGDYLTTYLGHFN
jgi:hypothetical protein